LDNKCGAYENNLLNGNNGRTSLKVYKYNMQVSQELSGNSTTVDPLGTPHPQRGG